MNYKGFENVMNTLNLGADNGFITAVIGEPGSGKTTALNLFKKDHPEAILITCSPTTSIYELLLEIARGIGLQSIARNSFLVQKQIIEHLKSDSNHIIMFDECEYLHSGNVTKLEVIRQIYDQVKIVPMILSGTYKLKKLLVGNDKYDQPQLYRRLLCASFNPLTKLELSNYLKILENRYNLVFNEEAIKDLYDLCLDSDNGGIGLTFKLLEIILSTIRPNWRIINYEQDYLVDKELIDCFEDHVDVKQMPLITIGHRTSLEAGKIKMHR